MTVNVPSLLLRKPATGPNLVGSFSYVQLGDPMNMIPSFDSRISGISTYAPYAVGVPIVAGALQSIWTQPWARALVHAQSVLTAIVESVNFN
jgi:hypothetical protein